LPARRWPKAGGRAERSLGPIGVKADDAREAMASLKSLEPDEWAAAWSRIGERWPGA
jgi:hypothetical protein